MITSARITYTDETNKLTAHLESIAPNSVNLESHELGFKYAEPIIVIADALIRYAKAHNKKYEAKLADDYILGPGWLGCLRCVKTLLDGDGAVAMETGRSADTKDKGIVFQMLEEAVKISGFNWSDV